MDKNRLLTCPYDSSHRIFEHRMSKHLIKCKLNNDHIQLLTCPYNTIHRIKPLEYEKHLLECKNKRSDEIYEFKRNSSRTPNIIPVKKINELEIPSSSENWDEDPRTSQSYLQNLEEKTEEFPLAGPGKLKNKESKLQEQEYYDDNVTSISYFRPLTSESTDEDDRTTSNKDTIVKPFKLKDIPIDKLSISSDTKIRNNETIETPKGTTTECTLDRSKINKNSSIGRGTFRMYEMQRKLEMSEKKFMNSQSDVESLKAKRAEINYSRGVFVGYSEEDFNLDMDDIDD